MVICRPLSVPTAAPPEPGATAPAEAGWVLAPWARGRGLAREALFGGVAKRGGVVGLAVVQLAFNVPQSIVAFKALVVHPADMFQGAGGGGAQGHAFFMVTR